MMVGAALFAVAANASVMYDPTNVTGTMTANGWSLAAGSAQDITDGKVKDWSHSDPAGGTNGVWHVEDTNAGGNAYMWAWKNDPGSLDQSRGMVMARINMFGSSTNSGTFGYSSAASDRSLLMSIRDGGVNFKNGQGGGDGSTMAVPGGTLNQFRVYVISYYNDGGGWRFDAWISNGNDWSSNSADWTQLVANSSGYTIGTGTLKDHVAGSITGVLLGSFGSSGNYQNYAADWLFASYTDVNGDSLMTPWADGVPEPATLALLVLGGIPMLRRRR